MSKFATFMSRWTAMVMLQALCLFSLSAQAKIDVDALLQHSGLSTQIESVPMMMKAGFAQAANDPSIDTETLESITALADKHIDVASFKKVLAVELGKKLDKKHIAEIMKWYQSDLGKKFVAADAKATDPAFMAQLQQQAQAIMADTMRIDYAKRLDALLGLTDRMLDMQTNVTAAMYGVMGAMTGQAADVEMLRTQLSAQMASQRGQLESMIVMMTAGMYQDMSKADLDKYEQFVNSDAGRQFNQVVFVQLTNWIERSSIAWVKDVVKLVASKTPASAPALGSQG